MAGARRRAGGCAGGRFERRFAGRRARNAAAAARDRVRSGLNSRGEAGAKAGAPRAQRGGWDAGERARARGGGGRCGPHRARCERGVRRRWAAASRAMASREELESLPRRELQALAKVAGVPANLSSAALVVALLDSGAGGDAAGAGDDDAEVAASDDDVEVEAEIASDGDCEVGGEGRTGRVAAEPAGEATGTPPKRRRSSLGAFADAARSLVNAVASPFAAPLPPRSASKPAPLRVPTLTRQASQSSSSPGSDDSGASLSRRKSVSFNLTPRHRAPGSYNQLEDEAFCDSPVPPTPHFAPVPILKRDMSVKKAALPSPSAAASAGARLAAAGFTTVARRAKETVKALLRYTAPSANDAAAGRAAPAPQEAKDYVPLEESDVEADGAEEEDTDADVADEVSEDEHAASEEVEERRKSVGIYERLYSLHGKGDKPQGAVKSTSTKANSRAGAFDLKASLAKTPTWKMKSGKISRAAAADGEAPEQLAT